VSPIMIAPPRSECESYIVDELSAHRLVGHFMTSLSPLSARDIPISDRLTCYLGQRTFRRDADFRR
jgi:hypothetical protein